MDIRNHLILIKRKYLNLCKSDYKDDVRIYNWIYSPKDEFWEQFLWLIVDADDILLDLKD